jgi:cytochrome c-type biogenesis protein CcmH/NrfG
LASQNRISEAIAEYREALRLRPDLLPALSGLAWIMATDENASLRNAGEAVQLAERLCAATKHQQGNDLDILAAAYAEAGRFDDAVEAAQKAQELAAASGQQELAQHIQERLKLYRAGRPFHGGSAAQTPPS